MVKLKRNHSFQSTKMKKSDIPIYHSANWMNSMMKFNFHHVEMNMIQLDIMLLFNLFISLSILSPSFPKDIEIEHNWLKVIIYSFEGIFVMESRQYSHCYWVGRRKWMTALLNGDDGINGESEWWLKLLEDEKCWRRKSTIESLLEIVFGWKYGVCREDKRRLSCDVSFEWIRKKWLFSFEIHQTQLWYSSISHCELDWIKKKFIPFQTTCIYQLMVKLCYYFIHNKNEGQRKMVEKRLICLPLKQLKKKRTWNKIWKNNQIK